MGDREMAFHVMTCRVLARKERSQYEHGGKKVSN